MIILKMPVVSPLLQSNKYVPGFRFGFSSNLRSVIFDSKTSLSNRSYIITSTSGLKDFGNSTIKPPLLGFGYTSMGSVIAFPKPL
jgi:hypothetical protein